MNKISDYLHMKKMKLLLFGLCIASCVSTSTGAELVLDTDQQLFSGIAALLGIVPAADRGAFQESLKNSYPKGASRQAVLRSVCARLPIVSEKSDLRYIVSTDPDSIVCSLAIIVRSQEVRLAVVWRFSERDGLLSVVDRLSFSTKEIPASGDKIAP